MSDTGIFAMLAGCALAELRAIIETVGANVFVVDALAPAGFSVIAVNARAAQASGTTDIESLGRAPGDALPKDLVTQLSADFRRCVSERATIEVEAAVDLPSGQGWWHFVLVPLIDRDGRVARIKVTATDQTPQRRAELHAQDELFDAMFRHAGVGMSLTDEEGRFVRVNPTWCEMLGYRDDEVIGQPVTVILAPHEQGWVVEAYRRGLAEPLRAGAIDCEAVAKSGRRLTISVGTARFVGRDGRTYLLHTVADVTERRRHEQALAESEGWLKEAQRLGHLGYSRADLKTGAMLWSPELYEIHGLTPETFTPTLEAWRARVHPEDRHLLEGARSRVCLGQGIGKCDYRIIRPSGEIRWIHSEWRVEYAQDGTPATCFSVRQDVTERRKREEELLRANLSKTRFLATAGHDLLQPLEAMGMFIGAARRYINDPHGVEVLDDLLATKQSMRRLLRSLLDFAALETGNLSAHPRPVRLGPVIRQICEEHVRFANEKGIALRRVDTTLTVQTDPALIERILRNLVGNAVRYTETGRVLVGCRQLEGGSLRIEVHDTGPGIAKADLNRIFQEFEQIQRRDSDRSEGVGLGLTIADRLARMLGHAIIVRSTPGKGSMFGVTIARPMTDQPALAASARCMASTA